MLNFQDKLFLSFYFHLRLFYNLFLHSDSAITDPCMVFHPDGYFRFALLFTSVELVDISRL